MYVKVSVKMPIKSFENPDPAVAYYFRLNLPLSFSQPRVHNFAAPCTFPIYSSHGSPR